LAAGEDGCLGITPEVPEILRCFRGHQMGGPIFGGKIKLDTNLWQFWKEFPGKNNNMHVFGLVIHYDSCFFGWNLKNEWFPSSDFFLPNLHFQVKHGKICPGT